MLPGAGICRPRAAWPRSHTSALTVRHEQRPAPLGRRPGSQLSSSCKQSVGCQRRWGSAGCKTLVAVKRPGALGLLTAAVHQHQGICYGPLLRQGRGSSRGRSIEILSDTASSGKVPDRSIKVLKATRWFARSTQGGMPSAVNPLHIEHRRYEPYAKELLSSAA